MYALLAQAAAEAAPEAEMWKAISSWGQTGAYGVITGLLVWVLVKHIPKKDNDHAEALTKKDTAFATALKEVRDWHSKECEQVRSDSKETREMLEQCVNEFNRTTMMLWEKMAGKT